MPHEMLEINNMDEKIDWVEIVEPKTGDHMFANLRTGQCLWEPPQGAKVKETHDNQWWELYDSSTRRYYYYNATSQKTVWRKPKDGDIIPLAKLQQLKAKESTRKNSTGSTPKRNYENESSETKSNDVDKRQQNNNHDILNSRTREESDEERSRELKNTNNEINASLLGKELDAALHVSSISQVVSVTDSRKPRVKENSESQQPEITRSSSTGDADIKDNAPVTPPTDKQKSKSLKAPAVNRGLSPKHPRKPAPPKPPRGSTQATDFNKISDSDSYGSPERDFVSALRSPLPDYDGSKSTTSNVPEPDYENAEIIKGDVTDGAKHSISKNRGKSIKPARPPPIAPQKLANQSKIPPAPPAPPAPPVKKLVEGRRMLPKIDYESDDSREEAKSPFSKMMEEMQEYNDKLQTSSLDTQIDRGPSSSLNETCSPSGTLLPEQKHEKYSLYENAGHARQEVKEAESYQDDSTANENCFAERLTNMGMPANTAALVDACDPSSTSAPNTPKLETKSLARINSDTTVVTRKTSSPVIGEKAPIAFRPLSLMPMPGQSRDAKDGPRPSLASSTADRKELTKEVPLSTHRKGFFKRRRMSIASMLSWSKSPIKKPMVLTRDKQLRKEAIDVFKLILQYMGDRASRKSNSTLALEIVSKGWSTPNIRDEIYIQLCKQTTGNERSTSLQRGWELITACLAMFPPSNKFHSYLEGYIYRHLEPEQNELGVPVASYAKHCYKQLERICQSGAKRGLKRPSHEEIEQAKESVFHPSMFGNTLEDIMEIQHGHEAYVDRRLPWIMTTLADLVLSHNGLETEGIFRVPGDIDEVNLLKVQIDQWKMPTYVRDPHIPASLLKLWFRDLYEPLIPNVFYDRCIRNCDNPTVAISIVYALPELNSLVFCYLIRFLQAFMLPEVCAISKMDENNLAMVWAPNCLRCPSDDPMQIFENARKEMTFLRTLMQNLETSFLQGVL